MSEKRIDTRPEHLKKKTNLTNAASTMVRIRDVPDLYLNLLHQDILIKVLYYIRN